MCRAIPHQIIWGKDLENNGTYFRNLRNVLSDCNQEDHCNKAATTTPSNFLRWLHNAQFRIWKKVTIFVNLHDDFFYKSNNQQVIYILWYNISRKNCSAAQSLIQKLPTVNLEGYCTICSAAIIPQVCEDTL